MVTISQRRSPLNSPEYDGLEASRLPIVETTSVREEKPKLSARDRLCLIQTINALPPTQFDELVFALNPPKGVVASNSAPQGTRSKDLLDWMEGSSGPGLAAADEVLQVLIPKATKTAPQPLAFVMMGRMGDLAPSELEAIVELLRQKTGDESISLAFSRAGSIKLILNGSPEGLAKLQEMFDVGELEQLNLPSVEVVTPVDTNTEDARKARLIQALRLREQSLITKSSLDSDIADVIDNANAGALALALALDRSIDRAFAIDHARDLTVALDRSIDRVLVSAINSDRALARDLALASNRVRDLTLILNSDLTLDHDLASASALASEVASALASANDRARANALDRGLHGTDLNRADLSGANLRNMNLTGVDLTGADLTHADVTGTIFGDNPGLLVTDKRDLQSRGAIFLDPPSSDVPALVLR